MKDSGFLYSCGAAGCIAMAFLAGHGPVLIPAVITFIVVLTVTLSVDNICAAIRDK